jgi:N-hydroxyarylamine O-acetyltransferase
MSQSPSANPAPAAVPTSTLNLPAYFSRIGYTGPREATLDVLRQIQFCHATTIPFENLSVLLGQGIALDLAAIESKLVTQQRGGYCFEQNTLLMHVLVQLGFSVTPLSGRVRWMQPREFTPPRTHLFLRVTIDGVPWLADVGVGGPTPTAPLRLDTSEPQHTPHGMHRIINEDGRWYHQILLKSDNGVGSQWTDVYEFTGEEMPLIDRTVANWWTSTNPESKFNLNLLLAQACADGTRIGVFNRTFTHRRGGELLTTREINSPDELLALMDRDFGLRFAPGTRFGGSGKAWPT